MAEMAKLGLTLARQKLGQRSAVGADFAVILMLASTFLLLSKIYLGVTYAIVTYSFSIFLRIENFDLKPL